VEGTTDLFLESAWFEPVPVARTGRRLGVVSDSRYRFERGTDRGGVAAALERLTALVVQLAGGEAGPVVVGDHVREVVPVSIPFRPSRVERLSGVAMEPALVRGILERLGCLWQPAADGSGAGTVVPPGWRHDLHCEEDLVEEVVRIYGYDRVPVSAPLVALAVPPATAGSQLRERAREALVGLGYFEAIHFVFVNPSVQQQFAPDQPAVALLNPLSEEQSALRTTLVPGLVEAAVRNLRRGNTVVRLCEFGRVFLPQPDGRVVERERCAGVIAGVVQDRAWYASARQADVFDLKGDLETLGAQLQRGGWQFHAGVADAGRLSFLHPGRQACIGPAGGPQLGWMGQLHPVVQESFDVAVPLMLFELEFPETGTTAPVTMPTWSSFPAVARDFAFLVAGEVPVGAMLEAIREVDPVLIRRVTLFDVYAGTGVPAGTRSLGFEVLLQADDRTLTEEESQAVARQVVAQMQERFAAVLRGEADAGA
jgi:phenylalanyl-tRNA synthetase beta chain